MDIRIKVKNRKSGVISLIDNKVQAGHLTFEIDDRRILRAAHTVVDPAYQGQGLAQKLVDALVVYSIEKKYLIDPICIYIKRLSQRGGLLATRIESYSQADEIIQQMQAMGIPRKVEQAKRFFKTGKGEYAEGDIFLGLYQADVKTLLRRYSPLSEQTIIDLWQSPYHEARALGYVAIGKWIKQADNDATVSYLYDLYLKYAERCNNWDLVDCSAPIVIGRYWGDKSEEARLLALSSLAKSDDLWLQRIAIVGTIGLIRQGIYRDTFHLVNLLKGHKHDLMHKAMGWALREVGKHINQELLADWLDEHKHNLPRTTLRYAIERFPEQKRKAYLAK